MSQGQPQQAPAATSADAAPPPVWDEEQYLRALAHLERVQEQLDLARLAIPRIFETLTTRSSGPKQLYTSFKSASKSASRDLQNLRGAWQNDGTRSILVQVSSSYQANADLSVMEPKPEDGWAASLKATAIESGRASAGAADHEKAIATKEDGPSDPREVVDNFKKDHPSMEITLDEQDRRIDVTFKTGSNPLLFQLSPLGKSDDMSKFKAQCMGTKSYASEITNFLSTQSDSQDLRSLLELVQTYANAKTTSCAKCGNLLDRRAQIPTARQLSKQVDAGEGTPKSWLALHKGCVV